MIGQVSLVIAFSDEFPARLAHDRLRQQLLRRLLVDLEVDISAMNSLMVRLVELF